MGLGSKKLTAGARRFAVLTLTTITTAVTGVTTNGGPWGDLTDIVVATFQATFTYGSGGTTAKFWLQTSFDAGVTWVDVANFAFTTSTARTIHSVRSATAVAANYVATDGTLADNTIKDGLLGDRLRVKYTTTGTYAGGTTIQIDVVTKAS
jgi:hypothetical protein